MSGPGVILAIDPGKSGGIAYYTPADGSKPARAYAYPMPDTPGGVLELLRDAVAVAGGPERVEVFLESVSGYAGGPGQPGSAMFRFGEGFGFIQGACMALGVSVALVHPQRWQKALALGTRGATDKAAWKRKLRAAAERLFPSLRVTLKTADALLILAYALHLNGRIEP